MSSPRYARLAREEIVVLAFGIGLVIVAALRETLMSYGAL